jgi:hypothetical protein
MSDLTPAFRQRRPCPQRNRKTETGSAAPNRARLMTIDRSGSRIAAE